MAQVTETNVQPSTASTASALFAAIRAGLGVENAQDGLFANLLEQVTTAKDQQKAAEIIIPPQSNASAEEANNGCELMSRSNTRYNESDDYDVSSQSPQDRTITARSNPDSAGEEQTDRKNISNDNYAMNDMAARDDDDASPDDNVRANKEPSSEDAKISLTLAVEATSTAKTLATEPSSETAGADETGRMSSSSEETKETADGLAQAEQAAMLLLDKMIQFEQRLKQLGAVDSKESSEDSEDAGLADQLAAAINDEISPAKTKISPLKEIQNESTSEEFLSQEGKARMNAEGGKDSAADPDLLMPEQATQGEAGLENTLPENNADLLDLFKNVVAAPGGSATATQIAATTVSKGAFPSSGAGATDTTATTSNAAAQNNTTASTPLLAETTGTKGSYDFASQLAATRLIKGNPANLPNAVEQVTVLLRKQALEGSNEMSIQLKPAELGRIDIKLQFSSDNKVQGTVIADNPATLDLLLKDVGSLQRALQDAGLRADAGCLQFTLRGDGQAGSFASNGNGASQNNNFTSENQSLNNDEVTTPLTADIETYYLTPGRVNLQV